MVVQVAPVEKNVGETVCSLNFAQRVRTVELGQATKRTETSEMANMKDRLRELEVRCKNVNVLLLLLLLLLGFFFTIFISLT